jgi:hypothetical protein
LQLRRDTALSLRGHRGAVVAGVRRAARRRSARLKAAPATEADCLNLTRRPVRRDSSRACIYVLLYVIACTDGRVIRKPRQLISPTLSN